MTASAYALRITEKQAAFAERVCRKVVSRFGTFQQADKDDFIQGALLAIAENPPEKDEDIGFCVIGYLMSVIGFHRVDAERVDARLENEAKRLALLQSDQVEQKCVGERAEAAKKVVEEALAKTKLTPKQRLYIIAYLSGESHADTARRLGVGRSGVWDRFHEALVKIAKVVEWPM